jgi:hypothetical protein
MQAKILTLALWLEYVLGRYVAHLRVVGAFCSERRG